MNPEKPLQRYKIRKKIGTGGMASVFLALDTVLGRDVAIKMVHPHLLQHPETLKRFANEAQAIASLSHDNIVKIYDYGQSGSRPFIVMEYIDGCTLDTLLARDRQFPCLVALEIALQTLSGLVCAHEKGIYHRDVKPGNILVDVGGRVRITDFGIAYLVNAESVTLTGSFLGSPHYVSPEQVSNRKVGATTDVFSLGVLLYQCLTGVFPFDADTPHGTINAILSVDPPAPAVVNRRMILWLSDCIGTFLAKDPGQRPAAREALARLDALCMADGLRCGRETLAAFVNSVPGGDHGSTGLCSLYSDRARAAWHRRQVPTALRLFEQAGRFGVLETADARLVARISRQSAIRRIAMIAVVVALLGGAFAVLFPVVFKYCSRSMVPSDDNTARTALAERGPPVDRGVHHSGEETVVKAEPAGAVPGSVPEPSLKVERRAAAVTAPLQPGTVPLPARRESADTAGGRPAEPDEANGFFTCFTNPPWVTIYIDGLERGKTPTLSALPLSPGKHCVRLQRMNFIDCADSVVIAPTETTHVRVRLDPQRQGTVAQ